MAEVDTLVVGIGRLDRHSLEPLASPGRAVAMGGRLSMKCRCVARGDMGASGAEGECPLSSLRRGERVPG